MIPFTLISLIIIFKFICSLVEDYIAASIEFIVVRFKISDAFAGVTLIALANGAGDVVTAIVSGGGDDGVAYNIGALFGAGLFVCTLVMSFSIFGSDEQPIILNQNTFYRDIPFCTACTVFVIFQGGMGQITWWSSAIMLLIYAALVFVAYFQDSGNNKKEDLTNELNVSNGTDVFEEIIGPPVKKQTQMILKSLKKELKINVMAQMHLLSERKEAKIQRKGTEWNSKSFI